MPPPPMPPPPPDLNLALAHHRAGRLNEAAAAYQRILANRPNDPAALQGLAMLELARGRPEHALQLLHRALAANPDTLTAASCYGNLGIVLAELDRPQEALTAYQQSIAISPIAPLVRNNRGKLLFALGRPQEAAAELEQALQQQPNNPDIANNLGLVLRALNRTADAIAAFTGAIAARPDFADAHNNLAVVLQASGRTDNAIAAARHAIHLRPEFAEAHNTLGNALQARGHLPEAEAAYRQAIALRPNLAQAHNNLGNVLRAQRQTEPALAAYRAALAIAPHSATAHNNLGNALAATGDLDGAAAALQRSLELQPLANPARSNLASVLKDRGEVPEALRLFRQSADERPADPVPHSNYLFTLWCSPDQTNASIAAAHALWSRRHAEPLQQHHRPHDNDRRPDRPLRVGYVSPNFREHCMLLYFWPLLTHHDRQAVEIYCYSDVAAPDPWTARLSACVKVWQSVAGLPDAQLAQLIRDDKIDVLVDLTLHMGNSRLLCFARRPAPVQLCWFGYPGTTGAAAIDYRMTDPHLDPPDAPQPYPFVEKPYRLPDTFLCYDPLTSEPAVNDLPAAANGFVTFGCLSNFAKVNDHVLSAWASVLAKVPRSRLVMLVPAGSARRRATEFFARAGVAADRLDMLAFQPRPAYLATYQRIDLGLDTFPYNGHTTTFDSLWMGVPVVSLIGSTPVARAGLGVLRNVALAELAADSVEQFVELATAWAADLGRLAALRRQLRQRMTASPLMDAKKFTAAMERAYRQMWQAWCADAAPP